jgi:hypothetical protein
MDCDLQTLFKDQESNQFLTFPNSDHKIVNSVVLAF